MKSRQNLNVINNYNITFPSLIILITLLIKLLTISKINLIAEEAYYWNYANHLALSYLDHPPMVAYLIKIFATIFGINEFAIRLPGVICWAICAFFSYRLTKLIHKGSEIYAVLLLSILPFFFIQSLIMTPDLPLIAAWSACLYYLYLALVNDNKSAWYSAGIAFGLGLLSKYTIVLLLPATILYIIFIDKSYKKLLTPQPYIAIGIATIIFMPVIYWNATHEWVSFLFQSTRRFNASSTFSLHQLIGLLILFLTPVGVWNLIQIFKKSTINENKLTFKSQRFQQIFTCTPLLFFAIFSLVHEVKFNWIGPGLLAIIPWIATQITNKKSNLSKWSITTIVLLLGYIGIIICITSGKPTTIYKTIFTKFIDWNNFQSQVNKIATETTIKYNKPTIIIPIDKYNIASELAFYQAKSQKLKQINHTYEIIGRNIFGLDSLMYKYWYNEKPLTNEVMLLICGEKYLLEQLAVINNTTPLTPIENFWAISQGKNAEISKYYYQIVQMNKTNDAT